MNHTKLMAVVGLTALSLAACSDEVTKPNPNNTSANNTTVNNTTVNNTTANNTTVNNTTANNTTVNNTSANNTSANNTTANNTTANNETGCTPTETSTIPGVTISLTADKCVFTQAELAAGVTFTYEYEITEATSMLPSPRFSCWTSLPGNLPHVYEIAGDGQRFCLCDVGLCPPIDSEVVFEPGTYADDFEWTGRNWMGPSDTGNPMGEPFPPGNYTLTITSSGQVDGNEVEATVTAPIVVLP